jgi:hypothetical protein
MAAQPLVGEALTQKLIIWLPNFQTTSGRDQHTSTIEAHRSQSSLPAGEIEHYSEQRRTQTQQQQQQQQRSSKAAFSTARYMHQPTQLQPMRCERILYRHEVPYSQRAGVLVRSLSLHARLLGIRDTSSVLAPLKFSSIC